MNIPPALLEDVKQGRVVLLLGAGASLEATNSNGAQPPSGKGLASLLDDRFLGNRFPDMPLQVVAELAISETDIVTVQEFLRVFFSDFGATPSHRLLATFRWHGLATTNYDLITELAYDPPPNPAQRLVPFKSDKDRVQDLLQDRGSLAYLKLHGCITRTTDPDLPLILTPDQYVTHRRGRDRLFNMLKEWGHEHPIVFVGSSLQDLDLRQILLELSELEARPRYFLVSPDPPEPISRFWDAKRVTILSGTFTDFMTELDSVFPTALRSVTPAGTPSHPIASRIIVKDASLSPNALNFLTTNADYVHSGLPMEALQPSDFFSGINKQWAAIEKDLDVRRGLVDTILSDVVLVDEAADVPSVQLHAILAEAGGGKTISLRRLAWDAALSFGRLCIWLNGPPSFDALAEIFQLTRERVFLFVDDTAEHVLQIQDLVLRARKEGILLTIFTAERLNAWNMGCEELDPLVTSLHRLPYLRHEEIAALVAKLEQHGSLGKLAEHEHDARIEAFERKAGRQLLVALHEATHGKPFEEILIDEYNEIEPASARKLYLSVCVLNRLGIPVRAGLIARVHEIPFSEFRDRLFRPLEHVVQAKLDEVIKDYLYTARHPLIAAIVFEQILTNPDARYDEYSRLLAGLNLLYETDRASFFKLMRARALLDLFPDHTSVLELFRLANEIAGDEPFLYHQYGIYEMKRPNGNIGRAAELLAKARALGGNDRAIVHSLAELELLRAELASNPLERDYHRREAQQLATPLTQDPSRGSYGYHTLLKIAIARLRDTLTSDSPSQRDVDSRIQDVEQTLERALQRFPGDDYILTAEAEFAKLLRDDDRLLDALRRAFTSNRRSPFIARGLSTALKDRSQQPEALAVLEEALEANPGERKLHFSLAALLREMDSQDSARMIYHLRRSFTPGDANYEAQFWFAVYAFNYGNDEEQAAAKDLFKSIAHAPLPHGLRTSVRFVLADPATGAPQQFTGRIIRMETSYGFVERDGRGDWIFMHQDTFGGADWNDLAAGQLVNFQLGFNFRGAVAINVARSSGPASRASGMVSLC